MRTPRLVRVAGAISLLACLPLISGAGSPDVTLTRFEDRVRIEIGGALFTEYVFKGARRPYFHPVLAVDGTALTRDFPIKKQTGEDEDHPHHRSFWIAHSDVNGVDFWNEDDAGSRRPKGTIEHDALLETDSGKRGVIRARNRWVAHDGRVFCTDDTTLRIGATEHARWIDFEITLRAPAGAPVEMRDNKDGIIGLRLAPWMNMPRAPTSNRRFTGGQGKIVTARGDRDAAAWGKRAAWCDYHAERGGAIYGVAIFDHPENLRHPTWWHARDYGLFAANPFGWHDFEPRTTTAGAGNHIIPAGGTLTLRYRVYFHTGDEKTAQLSERYADFAAGR